MQKSLKYGIKSRKRNAANEHVYKTINTVNFVYF